MKYSLVPRRRRERQAEHKERGRKGGTDRYKNKK